MFDSGGHRLVMTGTPLENRQLDLWSIFRFLFARAVGHPPDVRDRVGGPIAPVL